MGRLNSTGLPYLVLRPDAGQFTYHRAVAAAVAPFVVGEVLLAWSGRTRGLNGKSIVKISLATGDLKTARQRWAHVHGQVDALVRLAGLQAHRVEQPTDERSATRIVPAHIDIMARQAFHDVLATDDRTQVEPDYSTPDGGHSPSLVGTG